jgi:hypothetical protein
MGETKKWDKYEVALLIESVVRINSGVVSRQDELKSLSNILRNRAQQRGIKVDDKFRNYNGMSLQVASIESLLNPERTPRHCAKIFVQIVDLYNNKRNKFDAILSEAHQQVK